MVKTNKDKLLEIAVIGEIVHSAVEPSYMTNWDSKPTIGLGRGGIVYNVKLGDPCFGWAWGEKVEPGVSADGTGNDAQKNSFRNFSCIGNEAKIVKGEAKGEKGVVIGKVGYLPEGAHHLVLYFNNETLEKLAIGDKVQVRTAGVGLKFTDYPEVRAVGISPQLLESMRLSEKDGKLTVPVTKVIPPEYVGQGSGGSPAESRNWDVMTQSPDAVEFLRDLKLGDVVCLKDILTAWGRGYYEGACTVGVVSCGASNKMGQGIGVTTIMTSEHGEIKPVIDPEANIAKYLGLGGE
ncbi:MAG: DUF4438 domain-containing protein [Candidatus Bathyarchaeota archaeon]|nr:DUF4438 domain-containing protein [Candidatus Bathyarchaeota archaeon]